jgi:hypothetical protein
LNEFGGCKYLGTVENSYFALVGVTNKNLSSYEIHSDTKIIAGSAFIGCSRFSSITIPNSVIDVGNYSFWGCSLTTVTIGNSVKRIGSNAFISCGELESITIPDSVTSIGYGAFWHCTSLTSINFEGTVDQWYSISINSFWIYNAGSYTIYCTDGQITKGGTVTYY